MWFCVGFLRLLRLSRLLRLRLRSRFFLYFSISEVRGFWEVDSTLAQGRVKSGVDFSQVDV